MNSVEKHAAPHKDEIRKMLGEVRQENYMEIEDLFKAAKYDASARYPYFHQYIGQYPEYFYDPYSHF